MASVIFSDSYAISGQGTINANVRLTFSENYSSSNNKTTLTLSKLEFQYVGNTTNWGIFNILGNIKVNNTTIATIDNTGTGKKATVTINDGNYHEADISNVTITPIIVEHNSDGTKKVNVQLINGLQQEGMNFFCAYSYQSAYLQIPVGVRAPVTKEMSLTTHAYTLTTQANDSSFGTVTAGGNLAPTATKSLTATPAATTAQYAYAFNKWTNTAGTLSNATSNPTTFTMGTANAIVTANFTRTLRSYTITCQDRVGSSSGTLLGSKTATYDYGKKVSGASFGSSATYDAYYTGYHYTGSSTEITVTGTATVYRYFALNTWSVTYNANGGSSTPPTQTKTYNVALTLAAAISRANSSANSYTITYNYGGNGTSNTTASAARTTSYTFSKWNTKSDGTGTDYNASASYTTNAGLILYAKWSSTTTTSPVTLPSPTWTGYTFNGWYTAASGGTRVGGAGSSYTASGNITLYAQWSINTYTVTYNANGGSVSPSSDTANYNSSVTLPIPTQTGYTCVGWYTASTGGTKVGNAGASYTVKSNITLYAQWSINSYKLTVDPNGGSWNGSPSSQTFTQNYNTTKTISNPTRTGYTFTGWTLTGGGTLSGTTYTFKTSNGTLKAQWSVNSYTVSLTAGDYIASVSGGGSKNYGSTVTITATLGSATGYTTTFDGWYSGTTKVSSDRTYTFTMGAANISLTAKGTRTINSYSLSLIKGDYINTVSGNGNKQYNSSVTVSATLSMVTGYTTTFNGWYEGSTKKSSNQSYTFNMPANNLSLTAKGSITVNSYTLSISQGTGSTISVNRTSSPNKGAATGPLNSGDTIYYGDVLSVSFNANTGYNITSKKINNVSVNATSTHTVASAVNIVSTASLITYTLSISTSPLGVSTSVNRLTSPIGGGNIGNITNGANLYYNDTLSISYTVGESYQLLNATVNNIDISSQSLPYNITVRSDVVININVKLGAIVYIGNEAYQIFIGNGTNWNQYQAYIGNGSTYDQY